MSSSMQLTRAADYGVRVMVALAGSEEGSRVSLPALTRASGAPESFLSKVLQSLAHAGLINSRRGLGGGFEISPQGREASIRAVVEAVDGPIALNVCLADGSPCKRSVWCPAHPVWAKAQQAMLEVLEGTRMSELADQGAANEFVLVVASCIAPAQGAGAGESVAGH
jgi:Rrf2 family iron-sulfur cluster assembly transcriptional regulator